MGAWGVRSRGLRPTDSLRLKGRGTDGAGSGTVRAKRALGLEVVEEEVVVLLEVEQNGGGCVELRARLQ